MCIESCALDHLYAFRTTGSRTASLMAISNHKQWTPRTSGLIGFFQIPWIGEIFLPSKSGSHFKLPPYNRSHCTKLLGETSHLEFINASDIQGSWLGFIHLGVATSGLKPHNKCNRIFKYAHHCNLAASASNILWVLQRRWNWSTIMLGLTVAISSVSPACTVFQTPHVTITFKRYYNGVILEAYVLSLKQGNPFMHYFEIAWDIEGMLTADRVIYCWSVGYGGAGVTSQVPRVDWFTLKEVLK